MSTNININDRNERWKYKSFEKKMIPLGIALSIWIEYWKKRKGKTKVKKKGKRKILLRTSDNNK